jgi:hypothetical protein
MIDLLLHANEILNELIILIVGEVLGILIDGIGFLGIFHFHLIFSVFFWSWLLGVIVVFGLF